MRGEFHTYIFRCCHRQHYESSIGLCLGKKKPSLDNLACTKHIDRYTVALLFHCNWSKSLFRTEPTNHLKFHDQLPLTPKQLRLYIFLQLLLNFANSAVKEA